MLLRVLCLLGLGLLGASASAADLPGSSDHPLIRRFAGSEIIGYSTKRFEEYELQTSTFKAYNRDTVKAEYVQPPLRVEGAYTQIWYEAAGTSITELHRNYVNELAAKGFTVLYDSTKDPKAGWWENFFAPLKPIKNNRSDVIIRAAPLGPRTASAKLSRPEGDVYVHVSVVEWENETPGYKAKKGAYAVLDVVEARPMVQNMVVVNADQISRSIQETGRVALYGIYFDTSKADVKPESKAALDEIAKFLKQSPAVQLHVVGHTDNVGGLSPNLDLSRRRADAVVAALVKTYGVAAKRLTANGVAYLAPVATNGTDEGRAKNRRVELVPW